MGSGSKLPLSLRERLERGDHNVIWRLHFEKPEGGRIVREIVWLRGAQGNVAKEADNGTL